MRSIDRSFYESPEWRRCKATYLEKANHLCERCLAKGLYEPAKIVHHKVHLTPDTMTPELMYGLLDGITSDIKEIIAMLEESEAKPMDLCCCLQNDRHGESACRDAVCNPAIWGFACKNKYVIYLHKKLDEEVRVRMDAEAKLEKYRKAIKPFVNICRDVVEACDNNKEEGVV